MKLDSFSGAEGDEFIRALKAKAIGPTKIGLADDVPVCGVKPRGPVERVMEAHARGAGGYASYEWNLHVTADNLVYLGLDMSFEEPERGEALVFFDFQNQAHLIAAAAAYHCGKIGLTLEPTDNKAVGVLFIECESEGVVGVALEVWAAARG